MVGNKFCSCCYSSKHLPECMRPGVQSGAFIFVHACAELPDFESREAQANVEEPVELPNFALREEQVDLPVESQTDRFARLRRKMGEKTQKVSPIPVVAVPPTRRRIVVIAQKVCRSAPRRYFIAN